MTEADYQFLAEQSVDMICRVGMDQRVLWASPSCLDLSGYRPEELTGSSPEMLIVAEDLPVIAAAAARAQDPGVRNSPATVRMRRKDEAVIWVEINARLVRDSVTSVPVEVVLGMRDVTQRKELEEELGRLALTDGLTGLVNRRGFDEALKKEWRRTLREGSQISLLLLDIDHFKSFNDHYGHQMGDDCLRAVCLAVKSAAHRLIDVVARYGGEEIAMILPISDADGAMHVAQRVRAAIEKLKIPHAGRGVAGGFVTASIGVATALARNGGTMRMPESLLLAADNALYKAKAAGRDGIATALLIASPLGEMTNSG